MDSSVKLCRGCSREIEETRRNKVWCSQACHVLYLRRFSEKPQAYLERIGKQASKDGKEQI